MTNKVVNGGRWLVAVLFAVEGAGLVWSTVTGAVDALGRSSRGESASFYPVYMDALWSVTTIACAWGILSWQLWARYLALFLSTLDLIAAVVGMFFIGTSGTSVALTLALVLVSAIMIWLLLPSVRAEYVRKALTA
ncbi:MAG: hypothetical protein WCA00_15890 [Candidatus Acidiferrales bacterium]